MRLLTSLFIREEEEKEVSNKVKTAQTAIYVIP